MSANPAAGIGHSWKLAAHMAESILASGDYPGSGTWSKFKVLHVSEMSHVPDLSFKPCTLNR